MKLKAAVISDTHGLLRPQVIDIIMDCDYILHCGDFTNELVYTDLRSLGKLIAVRGNNDRPWELDLPERLAVRLGGAEIFMVHDRADVPLSGLSADIILFGHSHRYYECVKDGVLWLNPGSCGRHRRGTDLSMAILYLEDGKYSVERIDLDE